jgi:hypothetical protein
MVGIGVSAGGLKSEMRFGSLRKIPRTLLDYRAANEKLEYLNRAYEHIWGEARGAQ